MRLVAVFMFMCAAVGVFAQDRPPPSAAEDDEPAVRIAVREADQVEEVRVGARVVMLKVTPPGGKPYYLLENGLRRESLDDGVSFPMWPVLLFD
jgi:hypothetical protein